MAIITRQGIMYLLMFLLLVSYVCGFSIAPAKLNYDFIPGRVIHDSIRISGDSVKNFRASLSTSGELAAYINLSKNNVLVNGSVEVPFSLKLPATLHPGISEGKIIVLINKGVFVYQLASQIRIRTPYPYAYVENKPLIKVQDHEVIIKNTLINKGVPTNVTVRVSIADNGTTEFTANKSLLLSSNEQKDIVVHTQLLGGEYNLTIAIAYSNKTAILSKKIRVGSPKVIVTLLSNYSVISEGFIAVGIFNDYNIPVSNYWLDGTIYKDGKVVAKTFSNKTSLEPHQFLTVKLPVNLEEGNYTLELLSNHADLYLFNITIKNSSQMTSSASIPMQEQPISAASISFKKSTLIGGLLFLLVTIVMIVLFFKQRRSDDDYEID